MATEIDFRVKNGLVVGTNATVTGTVTASNFIGDGTGITGVTVTSAATYSSLTGTVPTWNQNTTGTAAGLSSTLAVLSGGTGVTSATGTGSVVLSVSPTFTGTVSGISKSMVGLGNVDNTTDVNKPVSSATQDALDSVSSATQTALDLKSPLLSPTFTGTVSGISKSMIGLDNVDNTSDANKPVSTAAQAALDLKSPLTSPTFTGTVSGISKSMVGLSNATNTSDANKPVSTATQTALDLKASLASPTFTGTVSGISKSMVGLSNVDNTSDANKPVSTATQTALDLKSPLLSPTFTGTVSGISKSMIGLDNVDNTSDANKPVSTAAQAALDFKSPIESPTFTGTPAVPTATSGTNTTQIASTAYVRSEVAALVASSPSALDTLNELATALGNDANFATTVTDSLSLKAPLDSPTFTGTVTVSGTLSNTSVTALKLPVGLTAERPGTPLTGHMRYNTTLGQFEGYSGAAWGSIGGGATGGTGDAVFFENSKTIASSYTISSNKNAMCTGPITIGSGATVTVPSGSRWVVL